MDKKLNTSRKKAKRKNYDNIGPGYIFISKYHCSEISGDGEFVKCAEGDLCIVLERRLNNSIIIPDDWSKYTFIILNLDRKVTFLIDRGFPSHLPVNSPVAAALYC